MLIKPATLLVILGLIYGNEGRTYGPPKPSGVPKPGECPPILLGGAQRSCIRDHNCPGAQKCCDDSSGLGKYCTDPVIALGGPGGGPGSLPTDIRLPFDGPLPHDPLRLPNPVDPAKPGYLKNPVPTGRQCPDVFPRGGAACIGDPCIDDRDCRRSEMCCTNACGRRTCMPSSLTLPIPVGPDPIYHVSCPAPSIVRSLSGPRPLYCTDESQCAPRENCCFDGARGVCIINSAVQPQPPIDGPILKPGYSGNKVVDPVIDPVLIDPVLRPVDPLPPVDGLIPKPGYSGGKPIDPLPLPRGGRDPRCPVPLPGSGAICEGNCQVSSDCPAGKICCFNGCSHRCVLNSDIIDPIGPVPLDPFVPGSGPLSRRRAECPATPIQLPTSPICRAVCQYDQDCRRSEICCTVPGCVQKVCRPVKIPVEPLLPHLPQNPLLDTRGECPATKIQLPTSKMCRDVCQHDLDCSRGEKCCTVLGCTSKVCRPIFIPVEPLIPKIPDHPILHQGECPATKIQLPSSKMCQAVCRRDFDCSRGEKCCNVLGCRTNVCRPVFIPVEPLLPVGGPVDPRPLDPIGDVLPLNKPRPSLPIDPLVDPLPRPMRLPSVIDPGLPRPAIRKEGNCPRPGPMIADCPSECLTDGECPGIQKCCIGGCGKRCVNPDVKRSYGP